MTNDWTPYLPGMIVFGIPALFTFGVNAYILWSLDFFQWYLYPFLCIYALMGWPLVISGYESSGKSCCCYYFGAIFYYIGITITLSFYLAPCFITGFLSTINFYAYVAYKSFMTAKDRNKDKTAVLRYLKGDCSYSHRLSEYDRLCVVHLFFLIKKGKGRFAGDSRMSIEQKQLSNGYNRRKSQYIVAQYLNKHVITPYNELVRDEKKIDMEEYMTLKISNTENQQVADKIHNVGFERALNNTYDRVLFLKNYGVKWFFPLDSDFCFFLDRHTVLHYFNLSLFVVWIAWTYYAKYVYLAQNEWQFEWLCVCLVYMVLDVIAVILRVICHHYHDKWMYVIFFHDLYYEGESVSRYQPKYETVWKILNGIYMDFLSRPVIMKLIVDRFDRDIGLVILDFLGHINDVEEEEP